MPFLKPFHTIDIPVFDTYSHFSLTSKSPLDRSFPTFQDEIDGLRSQLSGAESRRDSGLRELGEARTAVEKTREELNEVRTVAVKAQEELGRARKEVLAKEGEMRSLVGQLQEVNGYNDALKVRGQGGN